MAKVGGGAAYQRLQVPEDGLNQSLQYWGAQEAKRQADKKLADEREGIRQAERIKDIKDKYKFDITKYNISDAGFDDENQANIHLSRVLANRSANLLREAKRLELSGDIEGAQKLHDEAKMNELNFANEKELSAKHKLNYDWLIQNEDKLSGYATGYLNFYKAGAGMGKIIKDVNDEGMLIHMAEVEGEDGKKHLQVVSGKDIKTDNWRAYLRQDLNKETTDLVKDLSEIKREGTEGYYKTTRIEWDDGKENGIHSKVARGLIQAKLGSVEYMSDMVDQFDLYDEFNIDEDNPPINHKFTDEQKKIVEDLILEKVRGKYDETFGKDLEGARYSADSRAAEKDEDSALSQLNYDADQFMAGDYTGLLGTHESELGESINIREVIPAPNADYVVAVTDTGDKLEVPKTKRGFLEFKIRNKPEYKGLTPEKVMAVPATRYRTGIIGGGDISSIANKLFDAEGKPKVQDDKFMEVLNKTFGITSEDIGDDFWVGKEFKINGKIVSTRNKELFKKTLNEALGSKEKLNW